MPSTAGKRKNNEQQQQQQKFLPRNFVLEFRNLQLSLVWRADPWKVNREGVGIWRLLGRYRFSGGHGQQWPLETGTQCKVPTSLPKASRWDTPPSFQGPLCVFRFLWMSSSVAPVLHQPSCVITVDFDYRRRIRICCDELNLLVPFCNAETDKATTLQWTTAFLKYIQERHGDSLKKVSIHEVDFSVPKLCSVKMGIFLMWWLKRGQKLENFLL